MENSKYGFLSVVIAAAIFALSSSTSVNAMAIEKRAESQCGLLGDSIYCFGGFISDSLNDNQLYSLSLSNLSSSSNSRTVKDLAQSWTLVNHSNSEYELERRGKATSTVYSNNTLFITGGYTSCSTNMLNNQTIAYNRDTNKWYTLKSYTAASGNVQQVYGATAVSLTPVENTIALFGGNTENTNMSSVAPVQIDQLNNNIIHEGYTSIRTFLFDNNQWIERIAQKNTPTTFYFGQTATFNPKSGLIYYLGGYYYTSPDYSIEMQQDFTTANVFNTTSGDWQVIQLSGDQIPSPRLLPTATLLPNSNHILLFGGSETGQNAACIKFCYSLDLDTHRWALRTNEALVTADALRFGHSAVLVGTSLFIMFGYAVYGKPLDSTLVISVKDINNMYFSKTFPYAERAIVPITIDGGASLSTGAIAGISVAAVLAVLAAVSYFLYIRKKKRLENAMDEMSVDWDQVDEFYNKADNPHSFQLMGSPANVMMSKPNHGETEVRYTPNVYDDDAGSTTKDSKPPNSNSSATFTEQPAQIMKPSIIDVESDVKYVSHSSKPVTTRLKPDIHVEAT